MTDGSIRIRNIHGSPASYLEAQDQVLPHHHCKHSLDGLQIVLAWSMNANVRLIDMPPHLRLFVYLLNPFLQASQRSLAPTNLLPALAIL